MSFGSFKSETINITIYLMLLELTVLESHDQIKVQFWLHEID